MPEQKPADTPSPLAAAAEALLAVEDSCWWSEEAYEGGRSAAVAALRAALSADAAWRARAEAAVKYSDAEIAYREAPPGRDLAEGIAVNEAFDEYVAARRRYEETVAGKPHA